MDRSRSGRGSHSKPDRADPLARNRWIGKLVDQYPEPLLEIHPKLAAKYGIRENELVRVVTRRGAGEFPARLVETIRDLFPLIVTSGRSHYPNTTLSSRHSEWMTVVYPNSKQGQGPVPCGTVFAALGGVCQTLALVRRPYRVGFASAKMSGRFAEMILPPPSITAISGLAGF
jgi:hypothetical protein